MEKPDRIGFEFPFAPGIFGIRQPANPMTLAATMQRGACSMRYGGLQAVKTIIERKQRVLPKSDASGFFLLAQHR